MLLQGKKVLVTGAEGFIGSHLTEELVERGLNVRAFVLYNSFNSSGWLETLPVKIQGDIDIFYGDVRDPYGVRKAMKNCDIALHLAALIGIPYSYHSPSTYIDTNVKGTLNILQAGRDLDTRKIIVTSTSEVYGTAISVPINEEHPLQAQSPYAASKIGADQLALSFHRSFGTPVSVIRPFNTYGPRQSVRAVLPSVILQLARGSKTVRLGAIHPTRDFNYVKDTVRGFIALAEADNAVGEVVNIGTGYEISIENVAGLIAEIMNKDIHFAEDNHRLRPKKSEVERLCADNAKAAKLLGWKPEYAGRQGLKKGLEETIAWFSDRDNLTRYQRGDYAV